MPTPTTTPTPMPTPTTTPTPMPTPTTTPAPVLPTPTTNWGVIYGIIAAVVVIAGIVIWRWLGAIRRRRRATPGGH
jgi:hypothetical protein